MTDIERKVRQLDSDIGAIYSMLSSIKGTQHQHGNRLDAIDLTLDRMNNKFVKIDQRFDTMDRRFDVVDQKFGQVDEKLNRILGLIESSN